MIDEVRCWLAILCLDLALRVAPASRFKINLARAIREVGTW